MKRLFPILFLLVSTFASAQFYHPASIRLGSPVGVNQRIGDTTNRASLEITDTLILDSNIVFNKYAGLGVGVLGINNSGGGFFSLAGSGGANWLLTGNAGTIVGTNFLGTIDARGLMFKTNSIQSGYIDIVNSNTSFGLRSMISNSSGGFNAAFGYSALDSNTTGSGNVGIGFGAARVNKTGGSNTAVGSGALGENLVSNNTAIGNSALGSNTNGINNTATGTSALLENTTGSHNTAFGINSLLNNQTGDHNTAVGANSLADNSATNNVAVGDSASSKNTTGIANVAIGTNALLNNQTGGANVAIGDHALRFNKTNNNTAVGYGALYANTTGDLNTAAGLNALAFNTTGQYNTAVGEGAMALNNGSANVAFGSSAMVFCTNTTGNTALGYRSLYTGTTGNKNTAVGYGADIVTGTDSFAISLGYNAKAISKQLAISDSIRSVKIKNLPTGAGIKSLRFDPSTGLVTYSDTTTAAGTVTGVTATAPIVSSGGTTPNMSMTNQGTTTTVLHGNAAGNPAFSAVDLTADVTGVLPGANGGALNPTAIGQMLRSTGAGAWNLLNPATDGSFLRSFGIASLITWSTLKLPNAATIGDILQATSTNTYASLASVATGNALISGGVATANSWGKIGLTTHVSGVLPVANGGLNLSSYTIGDMIYASGTTTIAKLAIGSSGQILTVSGGLPAWTTATFASSTLTNTHIFVGNVSNVATDVAMSGDATISNTGAVTVGNNAISNAKFRQSAGLSVVGRSANSTGDVADITAGTDKFVLFRSGTTLGFGLLDTTNFSIFWQPVRSLINAVTPLSYNATTGAMSIAKDTSSIEFIIDGGGSVISTGIKGDLEIPFNCTITRATLLADQSGSIVVQIWSDLYANFPPTVADAIYSATPPTITTATKSQDSSLSSWTTAIPSGNILRFNVSSVSTITKCTISLKVTR